MPRKQRKRKVPKAKRMRKKGVKGTRRRNRIGHRITKSFWPTHPPDRQFVKFKTVFLASLTSTTTTPGQTAFALNDITDPSGALGTVQPYYYSQLLDFYGYYQVFAYKIKYTILFPQNTTTAVGTAVRISTCASPASSFGGFQEAEQQPYSKNRIIQFQSNPQRKFQSFFVCHKVVGLSRESYNTDWTNWGAAISSSPTSRMWFVFSYWSLDGTTTTSMNVQFEIEQYTMLHRRKVVAAS